jgi:hypothetical protein
VAASKWSAFPSKSDVIVAADAGLRLSLVVAAEAGTLTPADQARHLSSSAVQRKCARSTTCQNQLANHISVPSAMHPLGQNCTRQVPASSTGTTTVFAHNISGRSKAYDPQAGCCHTQSYRLQPAATPTSWVPAWQAAQTLDWMGLGGTSVAHLASCQNQSAATQTTTEEALHILLRRLLPREWCHCSSAGKPARVT